ncbi:odorant receptor 63a-like isoform X2 [Solenopsis invicta]|uniref:odorant receptor 63a-like isoform X2 n=1 Tax=Solenopsis invicta TaxID=13686 RepID=UPI00193E6CE8|nr:odorant receptor 63a-like isoform X2 [Solenopsis invicta]
MLYDYWKDKQLIFETFHYIIALIIFIVKLFNEFWNYDKVQSLYQAMENHWNIFTNEFEVCILKDYTSQSRKIIIIYSIMMYVALTIYLMPPFIPILFDLIWPLNESRPRVFSLSIKWRIDMDKYYVPIVCYNSITIMTGIIIMIGVDSIYISRTFHACSLFSIVSQQLEKIMSKADTKMKVSRYCGCYINTNVNRCCANAMFKLACEHVIYQEYVMCLKKYQIALEFVNILNSMYRTMTLISLAISCVILSLGGIQLVCVLDQLENVIKNGVLIVGILLQLLLICYPGQKLLDETENVFYKIYAVKWYAFPLKLKSLLIISLRKSSIPCGLTAGNLFSLSMVTYGTMVRAGISYFTTFLSLKD